MIARSTENLELDPLPAREAVFAVVFSCVLLAIAALDVPYAGRQLEALPWVTPTVAVIAFCALGLTASMLLAQYRVGGNAPLAILGCAFALAAAFRIAMFVCDPNTFGHIGWLGTGRQVTSWLRMFSRVSFDVMVALYAIVDLRERRDPGSARAGVTAIWGSAAAFFVAVTVVVVVINRARLPAIVDASHRFTPFYDHDVAPLMLVSSIVAAIVVLCAGNRRSRLRLWLSVDLIAMCAGTISRVAGGSIVSNGFYLSVGFEIVETTLFIFVVQAQIDATLRRAERTTARAHALSETLAVADAQSYNGIGELLGRVVEELDFDFAGLFRALGDELEVESVVGSNVFAKGQRVALAGTVTNRALADREMVIVDNFEAREWLAYAAAGSGRWKSACVLPLYAGDDEYGSLAFANSHERGERLSAFDQEYLRVVGLMVVNTIERIRQKRRLDELAYYDALTGLPNRVLLIDRISAAIATAERRTHGLAVHFLDLDDFKPVNDRFGHAVGDDVLRCVAQRLERTVRGSDTVARYGGDEFVILQPDVEGREGVADLQLRIVESLREPIEVPAGAFTISASAGVSVFPDDGRDAITLLLRADEAQYRSKDARKAARANLHFDASDRAADETGETIDEDHIFDASDGRSHR